MFIKGQVLDDCILISNDNNMTVKQKFKTSFLRILKKKSNISTRQTKKYTLLSKSNNDRFDEPDFDIIYKWWRKLAGPSTPNPATILHVIRL